MIKHVMQQLQQLLEQQKLKLLNPMMQNKQLPE